MPPRRSKNTCYQCRARKVCCDLPVQPNARQICGTLKLVADTLNLGTRLVAGVDQFHATPVHAFHCHVRSIPESRGRLVHRWEKLYQEGLGGFPPAGGVVPKSQGAQGGSRVTRVGQEDDNANQPTGKIPRASCPAEPWETRAKDSGNGLSKRMETNSPHLNRVPTMITEMSHPPRSTQKGAWASDQASRTQQQYQFFNM